MGIHDHCSIVICCYILQIAVRITLHNVFDMLFAPLQNSEVYWIDSGVPLEKFMELKHYQVSPHLQKTQARKSIII